MMKIVSFEFKDGARFQPGADQDAPAVGQHLELLRQRCKGELTARDVLDDAKHNNSPLHSFFEWSDSVAAEQYRLQQARGLIRSVVAVYSSPEKPNVKQRAYVHIAEPGAEHYREMSHALSRTDTRERVLKQAWREMQTRRKKYADLSEFADLVAEIDQTAKRLSA